ncbi:MAG: acylneuraminate cytidylyltransferase family protein [Proteobacteria bacterium]|nr:acylneuraminate cytidylyltransferase family protein [Pseudomonadota bacterium]
MKARYIAVVPARAGSTRLPGKNTRPFFGKPLVTYTLEAAREAGVFDEVVVTSDDPRVLEIAAGMNCRPLERPAHLATSTTKMSEVLVHLFDQPAYRGVDTFCLLLVTTPLRTAADIVESQSLLERERAVVVMGVSEFEVHPYFGVWQDESGRWVRVHEGVTLGPSQFFPKMYADNGAVYWCRTVDYLREKQLFSSNLAIYPMPRWKSVDIDTIDDWELAEFFYRKHVLGEKGADSA